MKSLITLVSTYIILASSSSIEQRTSDIKGCPPNFKNVVFNDYGYIPGWLPKIGAASNWEDFNLTATWNASPAEKAAMIPMMAFGTQSNVSAAVQMVNSAKPPAWMLTFNEPDLSYAGATPTMTPQEAAKAIQPLLDKPGKKTKYVAPVTANATSDWLPQFYKACKCQNFFSAYNVHVYFPTAPQVFDYVSAFRAKYNDKPLWITEVAPGQSDPLCSVGWSDAQDFMIQVYAWAKSVGYVDRVFWNSGNYDDGDSNVCNSYLLDSDNNPTPLLKTFQDLNCTNTTGPH